MLSRPWIRDPVWPAMRAAGARVLIYHSGDAELARRASYRRAIRGALERRWITFLHASRGETGADLAFWLADHAPPADVDAASRAELDRFLSITDAELMAPVVGIEFTEPVAPGAWHGGWAVDDSGVAEIRIDSELGPVGLAMLHMRHGGLARAFPDIPEAADDRAGFGFAIPKLPPGRHTLTFTVVANDGGVTVVKRPVEVLPAR
jgi:hypothetical protein